jgi:predicted RNA binding protein YcfA (HicA-like mRNA interferase family)
VAQHKGPPRLSGANEDWLVPLSQAGSHIKLRHRESKYPDYIWAFHDKEEIGPRMLARIAKHTGLQPSDL